MQFAGIVVRKPLACRERRAIDSEYASNRVIDFDNVCSEYCLQVLIEEPVAETLCLIDAFR